MLRNGDIIGIGNTMMGEYYGHIPGMTWKYHGIHHLVICYMAMENHMFVQYMYEVPVQRTK